MSQRRSIRIALECCLAILLSITLTPIANSQQSGSASLHGTVRDVLGRPVPGAAVQLQTTGSPQTPAIQTDAQGVYSLAGLREGVYHLKVAKRGYADAEIGSVFLSPRENKSVDLTLQSLNPDGNALSQPQFFDEPQFTVSGVTDTTSLGGHGSDTVVRTREALAKETLSLGKTSAHPPAPTADDQRLQEHAEHVRALLAQHDEPQLHHQLADLEERLGDSLEAVQQYQRAAEMDPSESHLFDWGAELLLHHAPEPAIEVFIRGNRRFPRSTRMLVGLGAAWFTRGNNDQAVRRICEASDLSPDDTAPYLFLGKMLRTQDAPSPEAIERLRRFVTLQPKNAEANYYYAVALGKLRQGPEENDRTAQAESFLKTALRLNPNYAPAYLQLGILHSEQRNYATAVSDYQRALHIDPQMEQAHYRLAQAYRLLGEEDKAKEELRLYELLAKESAEKAERERHEIRQFVYTLRDHELQPNP
jgi:tetratricopeptide (TPR) repeat protein